MITVFYPIMNLALIQHRDNDIGEELRCNQNIGQTTRANARNVVAVRNVRQCILELVMATVLMFASDAPDVVGICEECQDSCCAILF